MSDHNCTHDRFKALLLGTEKKITVRPGDYSVGDLIKIRDLSDQSTMLATVSAINREQCVVFEVENCRLLSFVGHYGKEIKVTQ